MIGYTTIGTNDMGKALAFYDALLAELGGKRVMELPTGSTLYGFAKGAMFGVFKPYDGNVQICGNGNMIALMADSPDKVQAVHAKALSLGGATEGDPGTRFGAFYGAYFRDLDGNKICVYHMG
jgi:catechol 2,3-dioxygenase-like lactoylglutathione lyase family enzyme